MERRKEKQSLSILKIKLTLLSWIFLVFICKSQVNSEIDLAFNFNTCEELADDGDIESAITCLEYALNEFEKNNSEDSAVMVLTRLGIFQARSGALERALIYNKRAFNIAERLTNDTLIADALNNIAGNYFELNQIDSASHYWKLSENHFVAAGDFNRSILFRLNQGAKYLQDDQNKKAVGYFQEILNDHPLDTLVRIISPMNIGIALMNDELNDSALIRLNDALSKSIEFDKPEYEIPALLNLGHLYYNMEDYKTSNDYYEAYHELKDSLYNAEISVTIEELENQFELEKEKLALADKELEALRWERTAIAIALVLLLLLTAGVLWYRNRKKVEQARSEAMFDAREKENKRIADLLWKEIGESSKEGKLLLSGQELPENTIPGAIAAARFLNNQQFNPFLAVSLKKALEHLVESLSKRHEIAVKAEMVDVQVPMKSRAKHYRAIEKLLLFIVQSKGTSEITFKLAEEGAGWIASFSTDGELNEKDAIWPLSKALVKRIDGKVKLQVQSNTNQIIAKANTD